VLIPDFEDSSAAGGGLSISGILVWSSDYAAASRQASLPEPHLQIAKAARRARLDGFHLKLTPRSFDLLLILAEGAIQGAVPVSLQYLLELLLHGNFSDKALGQAIHKLKFELTKSGVSCGRVQSMIENVRAVGYRLQLSTSDVRIDD
jgi:DNA-binding response OmpR family regulator